jgi:peroxiredoxin
MPFVWAAAIVALFILFAALAAAFIAVLRQQGILALQLGRIMKGQEGPEIGLKAPKFAARDVHTRRQITTGQLRGKPALIAFLSTQCGSCRDLVEPLNRLHAEAGSDVQVLVMLDVDFAGTEAFVHETGLEVPTVSDTEAQAYALYGIRLTPTVLVQDADTRVRAKGHSHTLEELHELLRELPGGRREPAPAAGISASHPALN